MRAEGAGEQALEDLRSGSIALESILQKALGDEFLEVALQGAMRFITVMQVV